MKQTLSRLRDKVLIRLFNAGETAKAAWRASYADPLDNPLRFDESKAPLAARSPRLTGKWAKFDLRGDYTKRQIEENDFPLPRS